MKTDYNELMREASGKVTINDPLVRFLYILLRDEVTPGRLEEILAFAGFEPDKENAEVIYTNGWLAQYAQYTRDRISGTG